MGNMGEIHQNMGENWEIWELWEIWERWGGPVVVEVGQIAAGITALQWLHLMLSFK